MKQKQEVPKVEPQTNPKVDAYMERLSNWKTENEALRTVLLSSGLQEDFKWGKPCYQFQKKNLAIIQSFKSYFALLFFDGHLLSDPQHVLVKAGENMTNGRQIRFSNVAEIEQSAPLILAYIRELCDHVKDGNHKHIKSIPTTFTYPLELTAFFKEEPAFQDAFERLTPGRIRAYLIYFTGAKQEKTRISRIEKSRDAIFSGKGLNE